VISLSHRPGHGIGHTHEGDTPMIWLDGLDNGLMAQMDTTFFEAGKTELPGHRPGVDVSGR
jgi:gentisate 1,2-dioxygenase